VLSLLHTRLRTHRASGVPRALSIGGRDVHRKARAQSRREIAKPYPVAGDTIHANVSAPGEACAMPPAYNAAAACADQPRRKAMRREIIRVEPLSTWLERWKAPASAVTRHGDTIYVSGFPPFDPDTGVVVDAPIERQTELVLQQLKLCVETAGSSLDNVLKCNVYCTSVEKFAAVNAIYVRFFPNDPPARIFVCVPAWPGRFDIEIDCIAAVA
jgi:2-iminobutanoate/2-iminopropanoate deaminase